MLTRAQKRKNFYNSLDIEFHKNSIPTPVKILLIKALRIRQFLFEHSIEIPAAIVSGIAFTNVPVYVSRHLTSC